MVRFFTTIVYAGVFVVVFAAVLSADTGLFPDRRRAQFLNTPGHTAVPFVYSLPGIGKGFGLLGAMTNIGGTYADIAGTLYGGDVSGQALSIDGIHLLPKRLMLDVGGAHLSAATIQNYGQRGMASDKDDYSLLELGNSIFAGSRLIATFAERRYEFFVGAYSASFKVESLRDKDGNVILETRDVSKSRSHTIVYGGRADLTDDKQDPRRGARLDVNLEHRPKKGIGPDYYVVDNAFTAYVPVGVQSTWAFNYFRSDAIMITKGVTDAAVIENEMGLDRSAITDPEELRIFQQVIDNAIVQNKYGSASPLGGYGRLRSYAMGRYGGAHTEFFGTEFRWNLTNEVRPFNIYIMKDIRTAIQIAFFYEIGTVADTGSGLWKKSRSSYGSGIRMVTESGIVYRVDLAFGQEGFAPSIFFQYPWELL